MKNFIEYELYVPSCTVNGARYDSDELEIFKKKVTAYFGGLTFSTQKNIGAWRISGITYYDEISIWKVLSDRGEAGDLFMRHLKESLQVALHQKEILILKRIVQLI